MYIENENSNTVLTKEKKDEIVFLALLKIRSMSFTKNNVFRIYELWYEMVVLLFKQGGKITRASTGLWEYVESLCHCKVDLYVTPEPSLLLKILQCSRLVWCGDCFIFVRFIDYETQVTEFIYFHYLIQVLIFIIISIRVVFHGKFETTESHRYILLWNFQNY